ncbi:hypothetical protein [Paenibacillus sp. IHBB 10380]|uniref:hypothetical protein n=1 Tax=Paenibacillus sp. IHBB 10380 TaxID=1566358 RepID=UPI0005CFEA7C|nr:hypothetical protein [Paenibacillus sp. IHBB 10380]AJS59033.1 hypothetical protein UB51_11820 [Paenibacillus sp. IHBB 10380]
MAILSTGPIDNNAVGGVRPTQQVTVKIVNRDAINISNILILGYYLNGIRTLYVSELFNVSPNEVVTKNYFANFDAYEFVFTTGNLAAVETEVSVWGKDAAGHLIDAHRVVASEELGAE